MFSLRLQGGIPLSEQLEARIAELIIGGEMAENEKLPAVREVAKALTINPNTVQKAYAELERQGFLYTVKGKGNYVSGGEELMENKKKELAGRMAELLKEADELGLDRETLIRKAGEMTI